MEFTQEINFLIEYEKKVYNNKLSSSIFYNHILKYLEKNNKDVKWKQLFEK